MPRYRITITSHDREAMLDLVRKYKLQVFDHGNRYSESTGYTVGAIAQPADIQKLKNAGYHVERHEDVDKLGRERQKEVGHGDRYERQPPTN
jgi:carboxypeptidase T